MSELIECVPNVSEGRDPRVLRALEDAVRATGASLLDASMDPDHHRAVLTFVGLRGDVLDAALGVLDEAIASVDLTRHDGVHPRIGALDVCPFIGVDADPAVVRRLAHDFGACAAERGLPVFFYGDAALVEARRQLPALRPGGGRRLLADLGRVPGLLPDLGPTRPHPTAGAIAVGVRDFLIAFNVDLETDDLLIARRIAGRVRESGGGLPAVRALGLPLASEGRVQVSMNLCDWRRTGLARAFDAVADAAREHGVRVHSSELIGLAPAAALDVEVARHVRLRDFDPDRHVFERRLR
ncbi:MAG: glutamate formimidoyltransferase [Planctomycetota bacterium]